MAEELLDGTDVVSALQKVGGERMAEGVAAGALVDAGRAYSACHGALYVRLVVVMPALCLFNLVSVGEIASAGGPDASRRDEAMRWHR